MKKIINRIGTWNLRTFLGTTRLAPLYKSTTDCTFLEYPEGFSAPKIQKFNFSGRASGLKSEVKEEFLISKEAQIAVLQWKAYIISFSH